MGNEGRLDDEMWEVDAWVNGKIPQPRIQKENFISSNSNLTSELIFFNHQFPNA